MGLCDEEGSRHDFINDGPILLFHATKQTIYLVYCPDIKSLELGRKGRDEEGLESKRMSRRRRCRVERGIGM